MSYTYKGESFIEYLEQAKNLVEAASIPNFDRYFDTKLYTDPILGSIRSVLYVLDFRIAKFLYLSPNTSEIEGYSRDEIMKIGPMGYFDLMHPTDVEIVIEKLFPAGMKYIADHKNIDHANLRIAYNYRIRQKDGSYRYMLQQFSYMMVDQELNPLVIMGTVTDISEIYTKPELFCRLTVKNKKGIWENVFEKYVSIADSPLSHQLTEKEFEIIRFVHDGHSSKEIAQRTNRSVETINTQRKSILNKTNCKSMTEVIVMAKENHWI